MKRRAFIAGIAGATAYPPAARAQQPAKPVIGYLSIPAINVRPNLVAAFRKGLGAAGFVAGNNVTIEYSTADGKVERLPELAADLVRRRVAVLVAVASPAALAAKRATQSIPIVFTSAADPVQVGLVQSLNRPGGNITGVYFLTTELVAKRLALMHEMAPWIARVAVLVNPTNAATAEPTMRDVAIVCRALGLGMQVFYASTRAEIDAAFAALVSWRPDALFVGPDAIFNFQRVQLVTLAAHHALPASYPLREFPEDGGLMSYGPDVADSFRQAGLYVGRILKGDKPSDLPVVQPTRYELVINLKTAKALKIEVPPMLLSGADEVIE